MLQSTANPSSAANAAWPTPAAAAALAGGRLTHSLSTPRSLPTLLASHHAPPSTAHRTHLPARSEQAEQMPAHSKGETEACCLSRQRDSARAPQHHVPGNVSCQGRKPHSTRMGACNFHSPGHTPFAPLKPVHQAWHHSQAWASGRAACPSLSSPEPPLDPAHHPIPTASLRAQGIQHQSPEQGDAAASPRSVFSAVAPPRAAQTAHLHCRWLGLGAGYRGISGRAPGPGSARGAAAPVYPPALQPLP